jgi:nicotinamidase-related amidase
MVNDITALYTPEQIAMLVPRLQKLVAGGIRKACVSSTCATRSTMRRNILNGQPDDRTSIEGTPGWEVIDALKPEPRDSPWAHRRGLTDDGG